MVVMGAAILKDAFYLLRFFFLILLQAISYILYFKTTSLHIHYTLPCIMFGIYYK